MTLAVAGLAPKDLMAFVSTHFSARAAAGKIPRKRRVSDDAWEGIYSFRNLIARLGRCKSSENENNIFNSLGGN